MQPNTRSLCISTILAIVALAVVDLAYARYASSHFVPNTTLRRAEAAGKGCLVTLGDSRMAAGIDAPVLYDTLRSRGTDICVAPLAIGALPISGQALALRRFVRDNGTPAWIVLGASTGTLLDEPSPDPSAFSGNRAAELAWSDRSDVYWYYPGFPFADLDAGARFLFARSNALSTYGSVVWLKTQGLQERLIGNAPKVPHNRFGALSDMRDLVSSFRDDALKRLAASGDGFRLSRWFELIRRIGHEAGARLVVIEVPMRSSYRAEVLESTTGRRYRHWLADELAESGDLYFDLSVPRSVSDENFKDGIHLDSAGAKAFSADLGEILADVLNPPKPLKH